MSSPACGKVVEPVRYVKIRFFVTEVFNLEDRQRAVDEARHGVVRSIIIRADRKRPVVNQPRDHVRGEGNDGSLERNNPQWVNVTSITQDAKTTTSSQHTFVATARIATPCRMACQAPMSWAFSGTIRRNWVVIFQASTRISHRLLNSARRGANGKDATNRVTKPNWITANIQTKNEKVVNQKMNMCC